MIIRLCKKCNDSAIKGKCLDKVHKLAVKGKWICPWQKPACGKTY